MLEESRKGGSGVVAVEVATPLQKQRTHARYQFTASVEALDSCHRTRMNARTGDLGKGGCYIDTFSPFPLKTGVKLRITRDNVSFEAEAKVVYSKMGMGMGLQFTTIEPQQSEVLDKWIAELSGTTPGDPPRPEDRHTPLTNSVPPKEPGYVLNELIVALMRKGMLTEQEGKTMLLRLIHHDFQP